MGRILQSSNPHPMPQGHDPMIRAVAKAIRANTKPVNGKLDYSKGVKMASSILKLPGEQ